MLRAKRGSGQGRIFYYPRRGFGQISTALAEAAVSAGADLRCNAKVTGVDVRADRVELRTADGQSLTANRVFSTMPLPTLARVMSPGPAPEILGGADELDFRAMLLVYVTHDGPRPWTEFDAHYLPGPETPVTRISEPANYRDSSDDPGDRTVLCAEIPCDRTDKLWFAADNALGEVVADAARCAGLPPLRITGTVVRRVRRVYPIYRVGYRRHLDGLDTWATTVPRVTTFGRLGLFAHDNTHHAMIMAYDAVDALAGDGFDAGQWSLARQRFAAHVVED
jgi:protoporphyrinogen oxidase